MFQDRMKALRIIECVQNSDEWIAARLGKATASRISDVMASGKGGAPSASRARYLAELVLERITGEREEGFTSKAMQVGLEREPEAVARYKFETGIDVCEVGFVLHPTIEGSGASPDRLAGLDGIAQFKCPDAHTHLAYLRGETLPRAYVCQVQWEMACTKSLWCDFVSYHPKFPIGKRLHVRRINRDSAMIVEAESAVRAFLSDVERAVADLLADEAGEVAA